MGLTVHKADALCSETVYHTLVNSRWSGLTYHGPVITIYLVAGIDRQVTQSIATTIDDL